MGRNWLAKIKLDWKNIHRLQEASLEDMLDRHKQVFLTDLGNMKGYTAKIFVEKEATPKYCKARPVPYAMRERVEEELDSLVKEGTLEPVQHSDWAAPIVPVVKSDGKSIRICGDFSQTVNRVSKLDRYPIPRVEDLLTELVGVHKIRPEPGLPTAGTRRVITPVRGYQHPQRSFQVHTTTMMGYPRPLVSSSEQWRTCCKAYQGLSSTLTTYW